MVIETTKIGAILGLSGSIILLIVGLAGISLSRSLSQPDPNYPAFLPYTIGGVTIAISAFGLFGTILIFRDNNFGFTILLIAGIVGIVCTFIPIYNYVSEYGYTHTYYLSNSLLYIDLVFMVVGGTLGFALVEKKRE
jgi:hypothetical protein